MLKLIRIDPANIPGLNILNSLDAQIFDSPWTAHQWAAEVENPGNTVLLISFDDELFFPAGFLTYSISGDVAELRKIGVLEQYRRRHLAADALNAVLASLREQNINNMLIEVAITNLSAVKLYENLGFYRISVRKKYYNRLVDALVMQKEI